MVAYWHTYIVLCLVIVLQNLKMAEITVTALIFFCRGLQTHCLNIHYCRKKNNERNVLRVLH